MRWRKATQSGGLERLARRARLTIEYEGGRAALSRLLALPIRFSPQPRRLGLGHRLLERRRRASAWVGVNRMQVRIVSPGGARLGGAPESDLLLQPGETRMSRLGVACLQYAAHAGARPVGVVGARLLAPDGTIASTGLERDSTVPRRFVSRHAGCPVHFSPAQVPGPVLAVRGEGMLVTRDLIERLGPPTVSTLFDCVDFCLRSWQCGYEVLYEPAAVLELPGASTVDPGEATAFWAQWQQFFSDRPVRTDHGRLRIIYVTEDTGVWGGHRVVFDDLQSLAARGHEVSLFTLGDRPDWVDLSIPIQRFKSYAELERALASVEAIKVATWWRTALPVWRASLLRGHAVYFVQDIESSYYPDAEADRQQVLATYRQEFRYLTTSGWNRDRLAELRREAPVIPPAIDPARFYPSNEPRRDDLVVAIARSEPLKRFDLTVAAWRKLDEPRPELCLFGGEPDLTPSGARHVGRITDQDLNKLLGSCAVFVQTSAHEGFALPPLEAMATGAAVVCTDADGNRDYCIHGVNCLVPEATADSIAEAVASLLRDPDLRRRMGAAGLATAQRYLPERRARALEEFMVETAA